MWVHFFSYPDFINLLVMSNNHKGFSLRIIATAFLLTKVRFVRSTKVKLISKPPRCISSICFRPTFEFWNSFFSWILPSKWQMSLDNTYLWVTEYFWILTCSLFLEESEFRHSNFGGKQIENMCPCQIWNKFNFNLIPITYLATYISYCMG